MPELPEVETIRRHLAPHVEGRTLERLTIHDPRWSLPLAPAELEQAVEGREVERLGRRVDCRTAVAARCARHLSGPAGGRSPAVPPMRRPCSSDVMSSAPRFS